MDRRRFVALAVLTSLAGCSTGGSGSDGSSGTPAQVTTTTADGVEFSLAQVAVRDEATGPEAHYRLENTADADATVKVETVLTIAEGGTYSAFAYVTVPAGDEVTLSYPIVAYDELSAAERRRLEQGEGVDFDVVVNGQERQDV